MFAETVGGPTVRILFYKQVKVRERERILFNNGRDPIIILLDGSEQRNREQLEFTLQSSAVVFIIPGISRLPNPWE